MMMMKSMLALAALATSVYAQSVTIAAPAAGTTFRAGQHFTVDIAEAGTREPSQDVSVIVALTSCAYGTGSCDQFDPTEMFGTILYAGPYTPSHHAGTPAGDVEYYQNLTLKVPNNFTPGAAYVNIAHLALTGAGNIPILDFENIIVTVKA
ncbi:hypothetical protein EUX98_g7492 [Antrodiella citrinella]|uniref:Uncharacterized protein n=1 Tax=Antrodiella citrinella TaxID=2447956 RepID=A0A4S4MLD8_9APHY|nr:hypothetical protein EUX98_g7492 [Antrodiella citrinella]